jgi:hypothetical protein
MSGMPNFMPNSERTIVPLSQRFSSRRQLKASTKSCQTSSDFGAARPRLRRIERGNGRRPSGTSSAVSKSDLQTGPRLYTSNVFPKFERTRRPLIGMGFRI